MEMSLPVTANDLLFVKHRKHLADTRQPGCGSYAAAIRKIKNEEEKILGRDVHFISLTDGFHHKTSLHNEQSIAPSGALFKVFLC